MGCQLFPTSPRDCDSDLLLGPTVLAVVGALLVEGHVDQLIVSIAPIVSGFRLCRNHRYHTSLRTAVLTIPIVTAIMYTAMTARVIAATVTAAFLVTVAASITTTDVSATLADLERVRTALPVTFTAHVRARSNPVHSQTRALSLHVMLLLAPVGEGEGVVVDLAEVLLGLLRGGCPEALTSVTLG